MMISDGIEFLFFSIEEVWKMFFENMREQLIDIHYLGLPEAYLAWGLQLLVLFSRSWEF